MEEDIDFHGALDAPGGRHDCGRVDRGLPPKQLDGSRRPWVLCEPGQNVSCKLHSNVNNHQLLSIPPLLSKNILNFEKLQTS